MRYLILTALLFPLTAMAADYSDAPLVVVGGQAKQAQVAATPPEARPKTNGEYAPWEPGFPAWAVTKAGENTTGQSNNMPDTPDAAPNAPQAPGVMGTQNPAAPEAPATPPSPAGKLWPRDTVKLFMPSCVNFHVELIPACGCTITNLMAAMPHDEFLQLSAEGTIEQDSRLVKIRHQCVGAKKE